MQITRRQILGAGTALPLAMSLEGCASLFGPSYDAVVDAGFTGKPGEGGRYKTLQQAIDAAPKDRAGKPWRISLPDGTYKEKVLVTQPDIQIVGQSRDKTILSNDAYSGLPKPGATGNWGTFECATLLIRAPGFSASNMTVENSFDYPANEVRDAKDPAFVRDPQAVALMTDKGSDHAFFDNVKITGYQDTLFTEAGRSYFRKCFVSGHVDFIFGGGTALFDQCEIVTRARFKPGVNPIGYVTAPSTQLSSKYGLIFIKCKLTKEEKVPAGSSPLGRPWHPTRTFPDGRYADPNAVGSSVFVECFMDDHITGEGWAAMQGTQKSGPDRTWFQPEDSRFFEYRNFGPGASTSPKRRQLSEAEATEYTVAAVMGDWKL